MTRSWSLGASVWLLGVSWTPSVFAKPSVDVSYQAPEAEVAIGSCPSATEFRRALEQRGADVTSSEALGRASALAAQIRRTGGSYVGELIVHAPGGETATRTVRDPECSEVANALALTAAIALGRTGGAAGDENGAPETAPTEEPIPVVETQHAAPPQEGVPERSGSAPARSTPRLRGSSFGQDDSVAVDAGTLELAAARAYTLTAGVHAGLVPGELMPRYDFTASLAGFLVPPGAESRLLGPILQVHWAALGPLTTQHGEVSLDTWGLEAGIDSCSALTYDNEGWVALLCAEFGMGWLFMDAATRGAAGSYSQSKGYGFAGLAFDAQYNLGSWAHLGLRVGGRLNTQIEAEGPAGSSLFESSPWGGYATIGVGFHF